MRVHRDPLLALLERYLQRHPDEEGEVERVRALVREHGDCFDRTCMPGHVTASCWIVSDDGQRCLMTHHRKLGRWLQLGGHADGDPDTGAVALREAQEESGMQAFALVRPPDGCAVVDVDVHTIPARPGEPEHEHHDVRYLLRAGAGQRLRISDESNDLRWFGWDELAHAEPDESVWRLARKARAILAAHGVPS